LPPASGQLEPGVGGFVISASGCSRALVAADDRATFAQIMDRVREQMADYTRRTYNEVQTLQTGGAMAARPVSAILR
jgi:hypothetical protein